MDSNTLKYEWLLVIKLKQINNNNDDPGGRNMNTLYFPQISKCIIKKENDRNPMKAGFILGWICA